MTVWGPAALQSELLRSLGIDCLDTFAATLVVLGKNVQFSMTDIFVSEPSWSLCTEMLDIPASVSLPSVLFQRNKYVVQESLEWMILDAGIQLLGYSPFLQSYFINLMVQCGMTTCFPPKAIQVLPPGTFTQTKTFTTQRCLDVLRVSFSKNQHGQLLRACADKLDTEQLGKQSGWNLLATPREMREVLGVRVRVTCLGKYEAFNDRQPFELELTTDPLNCGNFKGPASVKALIEKQNILADGWVLTCPAICINRDFFEAHHDQGDSHEDSSMSLLGDPETASLAKRRRLKLSCLGDPGTGSGYSQKPSFLDVLFREGARLLFKAVNIMTQEDAFVYVRIAVGREVKEGVTRRKCAEAISRKLAPWKKLKTE